MKKKFEILMVACLFISAYLLARASAALTSSRHAASSKTCIVLDAGHGGSDPGKVGCNDALEKDINLSIVLKLKTLFENKGYKVVLTRSDDTVPADENSRSVKVEDLRNRVKLITDTNPVMTISIHQNSFPDASVSGPQVFYFEQSAESSAIASVMQDTLNNSLNPPKNLFGHHSGHQDLFKFIDHFEFISRFDERCVDANHTQSVRVKPGINNN